MEIERKGSLLGVAQSLQAELETKLDEAAELEFGRPREAIDILISVLQFNEYQKQAILKVKEQAFDALLPLLENLGDVDSIVLLRDIMKPFFSSDNVPKAKTAKMVRQIVDAVGRIPETEDRQIALCSDVMEWATTENRTFLRDRIQFKLSALYFEREDFERALELLESLLARVRRLDDKPLLVEIHLLESQILHALRNISRSKAALTAARTAANAVYVAPHLQALMDLQSGILHAEDRDYKTAYSYFMESHEGNASDAALRYMMLCKIILNQCEEAIALVQTASQRTRGVEAMLAVASSYRERSLKRFESLLEEFHMELQKDPVIHVHLSALYNNLMEQNLLRILEPFSRVELSHVADIIDLPVDKVEKKISQMILDSRFNGIIDQGNGCIVAYEEERKRDMYGTALQGMDELSEVVDSLFSRARSLS